jgi:IPT/TIG domain
MAQTLPNPITAAMLTPANANAGYPRYNTPGDWSGAVYGDDVDSAKANVALATASGAAAYPDYAPRHQTAKAALMVPGPGNPAFVIVTDVARPRGWIAPNQPYQGNASIPAAPVVSSLAPTTIAAAALPITVTITGTGFTPWSTVRVGGVAQPEPSARYVDATHMTVNIVAGTVAGAVGVIVQDHDVDSNSVNFTVT